MWSVTDEVMDVILRPSLILRRPSFVHNTPLTIHNSPLTNSPIPVSFCPLILPPLYHPSTQSRPSPLFPRLSSLVLRSSPFALVHLCSCALIYHGEFASAQFSICNSSPATSNNGLKDTLSFVTSVKSLVMAWETIQRSFS